MPRWKSKLGFLPVSTDIDIVQVERVALNTIASAAK